MSKKKLNIIVGLFALAVGGFIYVIFRPNTYIAQLFANIGIVQNIRELLNCFSCEFLKYYFPDYLWCLSFGTIFIGITNINKYWCACFSLLFGVSWELLQLSGVINGTFDILDCLAYFLSVLTILIINIKVEKK